MGELLKMIPPNAKRIHTFCSVERDRKQLWVDLTVTRKKRSMDSAYLYRLENGKLIFDRYERVSRLRKEGVV